MLTAGVNFLTGGHLPAGDFLGGFGVLSRELGGLSGSRGRTPNPAAGAGIAAFPFLAQKKEASGFARPGGRCCLSLRTEARPLEAGLGSGWQCPGGWLGGSPKLFPGGRPHCPRVTEEAPRRPAQPHAPSGFPSAAVILGLGISREAPIPLGPRASSLSAAQAPQPLPRLLPSRALVPPPPPRGLRSSPRPASFLPGKPPRSSENPQFGAERPWLLAFLEPRAERGRTARSCPGVTVAIWGYVQAWRPPQPQLSGEVEGPVGLCPERAAAWRPGRGRR